MRNFKLEAIEKTRKYAYDFGGKLTLDQLNFRLISEQRVKILRKDAGFCLISEKEYGKKFGKIQKNKLEIARKFAFRLKKFSTITMVGLTGSVAAFYPQKEDDIDLMIVTKKDSLWITRLLVYIWTWFLGIKIRKGNSHHLCNRFCLNLWMERESLLVPPEKRNLKVAMDAILMIPIWEKAGTYVEFLENNSWIKEYLANGYAKRMQIAKLVKKEKSKVGLELIKKINWLAFKLQYWYMRKKIQKEKVTLRYAFFHPQG